MHFRQWKRRDFITLLGGAAAAWPLAARAQQPVIGVMSPLSVAAAARNLAALRSGLRDLGYSEGRNIRIEYRFADGAPDRYPALMAELIALQPVMILVGSTPAIVAASKVTRTTPLVWVGVADNPVALGLVESFARPGGNITGFLMSGDAGIVGKRLELLREAVPRVSRIGVLLAPDYAAAGTLDVLPAAARRLGLDARVYDARTGADIETALTAAGRDGAHALYVSQSPVFLQHRAQIIGRAASMRLPAIYFFREFVQSGGLLSYGSDLADMYRRAGSYIDKILKGTKPGELPVQSAEKFELAVNLKTAKALGLAISESFLLRADEVIE
jgi:putative tryptophan/tyrosine transport system substrate-binding protein